MELPQLNGLTPHHDTSLNGNPATNGHSHEPPLDQLELELPVVYDGQIPIGDLLSRVSQAIYAELSEQAETLPNMSDSARKRMLADWVVKTKKQIVKLYAVVRWARDADAVQKCMNITAFLMNQNQQFDHVMQGLTYAKTSLDPARLRNHDLLTSLDVLTTGTYRRLPSAIKKSVIPPVSITDLEALHTLRDIEDVIRYRLRMHEVIPVEMATYRITNGRVYFTVPKLFETSLCLTGALSGDGWFFLHVEFLITIGGDRTGMQEFPRTPSGIMKRHLTDEADARLAFYLPSKTSEGTPPTDAPPRPQLPEGSVDTPLVRLYNFLQMMSLSYQLEILWYQAERMRSLGWADYLKVEMINSRKTLIVSYWVRLPSKSIPGKPAPLAQRGNKLPSFGGKIRISIIETSVLDVRTAKQRILDDLELRAKLGGSKPSDKVENLKIIVSWEGAKGTLGVNIPDDVKVVEDDILATDPDNLDFEALLQGVVKRHSRAVLEIYQRQLQLQTMSKTFSHSGVVTLISSDGWDLLRVHLCADEIVVISIDARTGYISLRDTGDLAAAGRAPRFTLISEKLNECPGLLLEVLHHLRTTTIIDLVEQKVNSLGLLSYRSRNLPREELQKLGMDIRGMVYVQLANYPNHYLVIIITDDQFRYALITVRTAPDSMYNHLLLDDIAWLDSRRVHGVSQHDHDQAFNPSDPNGKFNLKTRVLRELYAYCCARVAYMNVERQFKLRGIPFTHVSSGDSASVAPEFEHVQSSLARSVPALCVQSMDILSGAPAAEAAMPNIRVIPLNWWSEKKAQVVTCVKLKYVQQPMGRGTSEASTVIRPSKRIIYDTTEAVVSFLSENVDTCVDEFLEEWARVSKMVVIAREVAQMTKDPNHPGMRLLSFDLQTVEFIYLSDYSVSITCTDQLSPTGGFFELFFSRNPLTDGSTGEELLPFDDYNPHEQAEPYLRTILGHRGLAASVNYLVEHLRDTLPIAIELEAIRQEHELEIEMYKRVDAFPKALGHYRIVYGENKYALDFRLMRNHQISITDVTWSLHGQARAPSSSTASHSSPSVRKVPLQKSSALGTPQPIPDLEQLISAALRQVRPSKKNTLTNVGAGVLCAVEDVRQVARALHQQVHQRLTP